MLLFLTLLTSCFIYPCMIMSSTKWVKVSAWVNSILCRCKKKRSCCLGLLQQFRLILYSLAMLLHHCFYELTSDSPATKSIRLSSEFWLADRICQIIELDYQNMVVYFHELLNETKTILHFSLPGGTSSSMQGTSWSIVMRRGQL